MEFCPHGARLVIDQLGRPVLLDSCSTCQELLDEHPDQTLPSPRCGAIRAVSTV